MYLIIIVGIPLVYSYLKSTFKTLICIHEQKLVTIVYECFISVGTNFVNRQQYNIKSYSLKFQFKMEILR